MGQAESKSIPHEENLITKKASPVSFLDMDVNYTIYISLSLACPGCFMLLWLITPIYTSNSHLDLTNLVQQGHVFRI
jgi:hypothetical protein